MRFEVLGPLVVEHSGAAVDVPGGKQRALLVALLLRVGRVVPSERLIDDVWAANPPADPAHALQQTVSRLRRILPSCGAAEEWLRWHPSGYQLAVDPDAVDLTRFEQLAELGRRQLAAGDQVAAADTLRRALGLWRGPVLGDVADLPFGQAAALRLAERRLAATEDRIEADLLRGQHDAVLVELEGLVADHPFRERLGAQLMRALYAGGRQADALDRYESTRHLLAETLGVDPGPQLRSVHQQILVQHPDLTRPTSAPYGPTVGRRSNLPASATSFVGRDADASRVLTLLKTSRMVTLTGPGGVGKTRLALQVAGRLVGGAVDGVWWVDLAPLGEPMLLADAILRVLEDQRGGRLAPPSGLETEPEERLRSFLADRELLLVLDNCEHLAEAVGRLAAVILARAPGVQILATSQCSLDIVGETLWPVPPLTVPPSDTVLSTGAVLDYAAARLFADRAAAAGGMGGTAADDVEAVAGICRALDGMPLAIELAAVRTRLLPPRQLLDRLHDRFAVLGTRNATGPARQRTLRAVVEWSCHLLTVTERVLLRRMAVFVGGARLDAIEQVCAHDDPDQGDANRVGAGAVGITADRIVDLLAGLVDKSLIMVAAADGEARYTMLETIRIYAAEQLADAGEQAALRTAHARYFADLAAASVPQLHGSRQLPWLHRLDAERSNLRAAIEFASAHGDGGTALRLAGALSHFWWLTGDVDDSHRLTTLALRAAGPVASPDRAAALTFVARLDARRGSTQEVVRILEQAADCYRISGDQDGAAVPTALLAHELYRQGRRQRSLELVAQSSASTGWPGAVAQMLSGGTASMHGDLHQAEHLLTTALVTFRDLGDRWGQVESLWRLGGVANVRGRYEQALDALEEGVELARQLGNTEQTIHLLASAGNILVLSGDHRAARARHEEALRLAERLSLESEIAFIRNGMGLCARRQGDCQRARDHHEHALAIYRRRGAESGLALTHAWLGYTAELEGDADQAEIHHLESLTIARTIGDPRAVALPLEGLAGAAILRGDHRRCTTLLGAAAALRASVDAPLPPAERVDVDRAAVAARARLDTETFDLAFDRGAEMTLDVACTYATTLPPS